MVSDFLGVPVYEGDVVVLPTGVVPEELRVGLVRKSSGEFVQLVTTNYRMVQVRGNNVIKVPYFNVNKETRDLLHKIASYVSQ